MYCYKFIVQYQYQTTAMDGSWLMKKHLFYIFHCIPFSFSDNWFKLPPYLKYKDCSFVFVWKVKTENIF